MSDRKVASVVSFSDPWCEHGQSHSVRRRSRAEVLGANVRAVGALLALAVVALLLSPTLSNAAGTTSVLGDHFFIVGPRNETVMEVRAYKDANVPGRVYMIAANRWSLKQTAVVRFRLRNTYGSLSGGPSLRYNAADSELYEQAYSVGIGNASQTMPLAVNVDPKLWQMNLDGRQLSDAESWKYASFWFSLRTTSLVSWSMECGLQGKENVMYERHPRDLFAQNCVGSQGQSTGTSGAPSGGSANQRSASPDWTDWGEWEPASCPDLWYSTRNSLKTSSGKQRLEFALQNKHAHAVQVDVTLTAPSASKSFSDTLQPGQTKRGSESGYYLDFPAQKAAFPFTTKTACKCPTCNFAPPLQWSEWKPWKPLGQTQVFITTHNSLTSSFGSNYRAEWGLRNDHEHAQKITIKVTIGSSSKEITDTLPPGQIRQGHMYGYSLDVTVPAAISWQSRVECPTCRRVRQADDQQQQAQQQAEQQRRQQEELQRQQEERQRQEAAAQEKARQVYEQEMERQRRSNEILAEGRERIEEIGAEASRKYDEINARFAGPASTEEVRELRSLAKSKLEEAVDAEADADRADALGDNILKQGANSGTKSGAILGGIVKISKTSQASKARSKASEARSVANRLQSQLNEAERRAQEPTFQQLTALTQRSNSARLRGDWSDAATAYGEAGDLEPANPDWRVCRAGALFQAGKADEAESSYQEALKLSESQTAGRTDVETRLFATNWKWLGDLCYQEGKYPQAERSYRESVRLFSQYPEARDEFEARSGVVKAILAQDKLSEASEECRKQTDESKRLEKTRGSLGDPKQCSAMHVALGTELLAKGKPKEAEEEFGQALKVNSEDAWAMMGKAKCQMARDKRKDAEKIAKSALKLSKYDVGAQIDVYDLLEEIAPGKYQMPDDVKQQTDSLREQREGAARVEARKPIENAIATAQQLLYGEKWPEAEAAFRKVVALEPDNADSQTNLGVTLYHQEKWAEAETAFRKALEMTPDSAQYRYNLGIVFEKQEKYAEAEAEYRESVRIEPGNLDRRVWLFDILAKQNKWDDASAQYREIAKLDAARAQKLLTDLSSKADSLSSSGKWSEAEIAYRHVIALEPDSVWQHLNRANALEHLGRLSEAETEYREARRLEDPPQEPSSYPSACVRLSKCLLAQRKWQETDTVLREAVTTHANYGISWQWLYGEMWLGQGRYNDAEGCLAGILRGTGGSLGEITQSHAWLCLAKARLGLGRKTDALYAARQSVTLGREPEDEKDIASARAIIAQIAPAQGAKPRSGSKPGRRQPAPAGSGASDARPVAPPPPPLPPPGPPPP